MKKKIYYAFLFILMIGSMNVFAKPNEYVYADDNLTVTDNQDASTFSFGNSVDVTSNINGASFSAGNVVNIKGQHDYIFTAGNSITIDEVSSKDVFVAGNNIIIKSSKIRDLFVAGASIDITSPIERNISIAGDKIVLKGTIGGDVYLEGDNIIIEEGTVIKGTLRYPEEANINISNEAKINSTKTFHLKDITEHKTYINSFIERVKTKLSAFCSMLIIGFILLWTCPTMFNNIEKLLEEAESILKNIGLGFLFLIALPFVAILTICTIIGIPLALIELVLYFVLIYLSIIPTAYYIGAKLLKDKIDNKYLLLTISLFGLYILRLIPIIGGWISFFSLLFGLGTYIYLFKASIKKK